MAELDFADFDVDREIARVNHIRSVHRARPEVASYEWCCEQNALLFAWISWRDRGRELVARRRPKEPPQGWYSLQRRKFSDCMFEQYGQESPDPEFLSWRARRLRELGREEDAKALEGRMPWE